MRSRAAYFCGLMLGLALGIASDASAQFQTPVEQNQGADQRPAVVEQSVLSAAALLSSLDRMVRVEFGNVSPREAFAALARAGAIRIEVDPAVPADLKVSASFRNVALGDALSMVSLNCGVRLVPGGRALVVAPAPTVSVGAPGMGQQNVVPNMVNPWVGWAESLNVPLAPGGETGYPRIVRFQAAGLQGGQMGQREAKCPHCASPVQAHWAFCPYCGQQRAAQERQAEMRFCWGCGRQLGAAVGRTQTVPVPNVGGQRR